ncbi:hypothetical protein, partial [uncultured Mailhella sp.]|uniref:hypothetical protein n=1 Tax=uncultured Mailhella sp. TaxID=1981031 RepID=UPI0025F93FD2
SLPSRHPHGTRRAAQPQDNYGGPGEIISPGGVRGGAPHCLSCLSGSLFSPSLLSRQKSGPASSRSALVAGVVEDHRRTLTK